MKNKERYNLKDLKPIVVKRNKNKFPPYQHWEVQIFENGVHVDTKYIKNGCMSDFLAWLESEAS